MTYPDTARRADLASIEPDAAESDSQDWDGIPAELLHSLHGYDTDSAGGCG
jgi:hypothetical protein